MGRHDFSTKTEHSRGGGRSNDAPVVGKRARTDELAVGAAPARPSPAQAPRGQRRSRAARRKERQRQRAIDHQDKQQQRQLDNEIGRDQREVEDVRTYHGDFIEMVFEDDARPYHELIDQLGLAGVQELHRAFAGRAGLPVLATLVDELFLGEVAPLVLVVRALGSGDALREVYAAFDGDMARLAMQLARLGIDGFAAAYLARQREYEAAEDKTSDPQDRLRTVAARMEKASGRDDRAAAESQAALVESSESVRHPEAHPVLLAWFELEAELDVLDRTKTQDPDALSERIDKINALLLQIDEAIATIETAWFAWLRYRHSLGKLREIHATAVARRADLFDLFQGSSRKMSFADQRMVPSFADFPAIVAKQRELDDRGVRTSSQAWAVVAADKKGETQQAHHRVMALQRLKVLNAEWETDYGEDDLDTILRHITALPVATSYFFKARPGANVAASPKLQEPLIDLLMKSEQFKNVWEVGASQASANLANRGAIEEQMGYGAALHRRSGKLHEMYRTDTPFDLSELDENEKPVIDAAEMPKYAGLVSPSQKHGVTKRYGSSHVVWKPTVRARMTHTPGDSWNRGEQGVGQLTGNAYPEVLLANADKTLIRLACAEATGRDKKWLAQARASDTDFGGAYIETQIHGDLTWHDVAEIVIGFGREAKLGGEEIENVSRAHARQLAKQLRQFATDHDYDFKVRVKDPSDG